MKSLGPLYVDTVAPLERKSPVFSYGWSQETEEPFRKSAVCIVLRVPFTAFGLAFGVWGEELSEEEALVTAIQARNHEVAGGVKTW